jgi:hypothetical protein
MSRSASSFAKVDVRMLERAIPLVPRWGCPTVARFPPAGSDALAGPPPKADQRTRRKHWWISHQWHPAWAELSGSERLPHFFLAAYRGQVGSVWSGGELSPKPKVAC